MKSLQIPPEGPLHVLHYWFAMTFGHAQSDSLQSLSFTFIKTIFTTVSDLSKTCSRIPSWNAESSREWCRKHHHWTFTKIIRIKLPLFHWLFQLINISNSMYCIRYSSRRNVHPCLCDPIRYHRLSDLKILRAWATCSTYSFSIDPEKVCWRQHPEVA
jgi:hypothetical protein